MTRHLGRRILADTAKRPYALVLDLVLYWKSIGYAIDIPCEMQFDMH